MFGALNDTALKRKLTALPVDEWQKLFESSPLQMTLNASLLSKDANYAVLQSALINMKKKLPHPAFIIIAGDFIWHNATTADSVLKKKTIRFIAGLFKSRFPGVPIIPEMGNNDTYGNDYAMQDPKFLKDFANAWEPNLPRASADSLKANGYYTCKTDNLKLIVINSSMLSYGSNYPQAAKMFTWLQRNLTATNGKNVWIVSHIPPGMNGYNNAPMWNINFTQQFVSDIVKYSAVVKFMIASHTHLNDFRVVYDASKNMEPVSFMRIVPSICSNHGNYPSFEIAEFNNDGEVIKETNHYLNLNTIPQFKNIEQVIWADTLSLPSSLKLGKINANNFSKLISDIKTDKTGQLLNNYIRFYNMGTPIDSAYTINHSNYMNYLRADSLK